ncbi:MAG: iron ABC transporter permease [Cytophagales bacterium]
MKISDWILSGLLIAGFLLSLFSGSQQLGMMDFAYQLFLGNEIINEIFWKLRLPRTVACLFCGAILAFAGVCTQGLFRNPMAEPSLLGVNSCALVFMLMGQWLQFQLFSFFNLRILAAFGGAFLCLFLLRIFIKNRNADTLMLILFGICFNAFLGAVITISYLLLPAEVLKNMFFWSVGDCSMVQWTHVWPLLLTLPILLIVGLRWSKSLDVFSLGSEEAKLLGIKIEKMQHIFLILIAVGVSVSLNAVGNIGFLALLSPHILRFWKGPNHRTLMIYTPIVGAIWMMTADFFSKISIWGTSLPIGVFIIATGLPLFLWGVLRRNYGIA